PRPHNSGHLTIEAAVTSQFEQQVRALCGLPLGSADLVRPAAMVNLLGDLWAGGEPDWAAALSADPGVKLHLYGKRVAAPRRNAAGSETSGEETTTLSPWISALALWNLPSLPAMANPFNSPSLATRPPPTCLKLRIALSPSTFISSKAGPEWTRS